LNFHFVFPSLKSFHHLKIAVRSSNADASLRKYLVAPPS
jgi:hypothetical protein